MTTEYKPRYGRPRATKQQYRRITLPGHPLADNTGRLLLHRYVLFEKIGYGPHLCHWCSTPVNWGRARGTLQPDHVDGDGLNNDPANLVPSCPPCNIRRANPTLVADTETFALDHGYRTRGEMRICEHCGTEFPFPLWDKRPDRGKYCGRDCKYASQAKHD